MPGIVAFKHASFACRAGLLRGLPRNLEHQHAVVWQPGSAPNRVLLQQRSTLEAKPDPPRPSGRSPEGSLQASEATTFESELGETSSRTHDYEGHYGQRSYSRWRWIYSRLFKQSSDMENASINHQYTPAEKEKLNNVESIDYLPPNSAVYRSWAERSFTRRTWDRWFMMGSIGIAVGVICYFLKTFIELLSHLKFSIVRFLIKHTNLFVAYLFNLAYSLGLVFISTWCVVNKAPQAGGAGVAEVMAYLNGCQLPKVFNLHTLWVKFVSCTTAVGSGLPVGPEGPMVHIGAMVGAALSQGHSTTLGFATGLFKRFQNPRDKRDFVTAGTAVGFATAFQAPIGGLMFAIEELASNTFSQALGWQIFFACTVAVFTVTTFKSAQYAVSAGQFGLFDGEAGTVLFEVQTQLSNHVAAMLPAVVIGLVSGTLAIAFTAMNLKAARLREAVFTKDKRLKILEPLLIISVFVTLGMLLPLAFPCTPTSCVMREGEGQPFCPPGVTTHVKRIVEESLELYTCKPGPDSEYPAASGSNVTLTRAYNELATLMSVPGEDAIRHLLSRGTHREFGYGALTVMLIYYFLGAVWTAGSAISSGVFVPMLMIGSCIGRFVGLVVVNWCAARGYGSGDLAPAGVFLPPSPWSWIDPGAFALIGAASFMGGVTRLTISITILMMEVSNDVRMLLPLLVGILTAKWVADAATHSLYHGLLEVKCIPWLPDSPESHKSLDLVAVSQAMSSPVVTVSENAKVSDLRHILQETKHNGFPVVKSTEIGEVFVGLITRDNLLVLLRKLRGVGPRGQPVLSSNRISYEDLSQQIVKPEDRALVNSQQENALRGSQMNGIQASQDETIDLREYSNTSAVSIQEGFSIERGYIIFRSMGLRHLTVVDHLNRVRGIITRKELMGYKLDEAVKRSEYGGPPLEV